MGSRFFLILLALIAIVGVVYFIMAPAPASPPANTPTAGTPDGNGEYASQVYGLAFTYPDDYDLSERDVEGSAQRLHHTITLQRKTDLPPPEGGEGPPSITIDIFQNNLDNQTTEDWIRNDSRSNFKLGEMTLASTTLGGKPALSYRWSGLYNGTTIATAQPEWIYAFSVTYFEMGDDIVQDFVAIRESVRLR